PRQVYRGQENKNQLIDLLIRAGGDRSRRGAPGMRRGRRIFADRLFTGCKRPVVVELLLDLPDNRPLEAKMDIPDRRLRPLTNHILGANRRRTRCPRRRPEFSYATAGRETASSTAESNGGSGKRERPACAGGDRRRSAKIRRRSHQSGRGFSLLCDGL